MNKKMNLFFSMLYTIILCITLTIAVFAEEYSAETDITPTLSPAELLEPYRMPLDSSLDPDYKGLSEEDNTKYQSLVNELFQDKIGDVPKNHVPENTHVWSQPTCTEEIHCTGFIKMEFPFSGSLQDTLSSISDEIADGKIEIDHIEIVKDDDTIDIKLGISSITEDYLKDNSSKIKSIIVYKNCNYSFGFKLEHEFKNMPVDSIYHIRTCVHCGETEGVPKIHTFTEPSCIKAAYCTECNFESPDENKQALGHDGVPCSRCGSGAQTTVTFPNGKVGIRTEGGDGYSDKIVIFFPGSGECTGENNRNQMVENGTLSYNKVGATTYSVFYGYDNSETTISAITEQIVNKEVAGYLERNNSENTEENRQKALDNLDFVFVGYSMGGPAAIEAKNTLQQQKTGETDDTKLILLDPSNRRGLDANDPNNTVLYATDFGTDHGGLPRAAASTVLALINSDSVDAERKVRDPSNTGGKATGNGTSGGGTSGGGTSGGSTSGGGTSGGGTSGGGSSGGSTSGGGTSGGGSSTNKISWKFLYDNNKPLLAKSNAYSSVELQAYNSILQDQINVASRGTRSAVVTVARFLAGMDKAIPYIDVDKEHSSYTGIGIYEKWGSGYGLNSQGYIDWIISNSGIKDYTSEPYTLNLSEEYKLLNYYSQVKPCDIIQNIGYVVDSNNNRTEDLEQKGICIVIGIDEEKIYVAECVSPGLQIREIKIAEIKAKLLNDDYSKGSIQFVVPLKNVDDGNFLTNMWDDQVWTSSLGSGNTTNNTSNSNNTDNSSSNNTPSSDTSTAASIMSADEEETFDLINQQRINNGLPALEVDLEVQKVARIKAQDMVSNAYFAHESPTYGTPSQMLLSFGINYSVSGENIAGNLTNAGAVNSWMNSPGHKANILSSDYNYTGIGVVDSPLYGKVYVQMFIGK